MLCLDVEGGLQLRRRRCWRQAQRRQNQRRLQLHRPLHACTLVTINDHISFYQSQDESTNDGMKGGQRRCTRSCARTGKGCRLRWTPWRRHLRAMLVLQGTMYLQGRLGLEGTTAGLEGANRLQGKNAELGRSAGLQGSLGRTSTGLHGVSGAPRRPHARTAGGGLTQ